MDLRALGSTGIDVSVLGLGTVKFGRNEQVKYPHEFKIPNDKDVMRVLDLAWSLGINFIDTAPAYGTSEERLGKLLGQRHDWIIETKVGEIFENGQSHFDFSAAHTRESVEDSLRKLRRDYLDVVLVHSSGDDMNIIHHQDALAELDKLKQKGLIRAFGMSTKTVEGGLWVVENCDVVMATCNLEHNEEQPVLDRARELNKGVVVKKGLLSGHAKVAAGGSGIERSFEHVLSQPAVSSMIVGTINTNHLRKNVEIAQQYSAVSE
ncbi:MAG: aldo/keto reductase [Gammaproteobacteria bacterium]|nr:aldo/keto reductase [Gammaproteobacteria bacterium]MCW8922100.1 aldo/keto reductase [Gammaproteobacteria bacterium]